jgi:hypothetical protein
MALNGYLVPHYPADLVREVMGPEFYDWGYEGQATYEAAEDPLFLPDEYDWSMEEGEPHEDGAVQDRGSVEQLINTTGAEQRFPDNNDYLNQAWNEWQQA